MDTPATLAFLGCCADRPVSQPLSLSLFPKETCKQSHSSYSCCAFLPCWVLILLTFEQLWAGQKQNTREFRKHMKLILQMENHWGETELLSPLSRENALLLGPRARALLHTPFAPFRVKPLSSGVTRVAAAVWLCLRRAKDVLSLKGWTRQSAAPLSVHSPSNQDRQEAA